METGTNILSYQGNAALGSGSNAGIPAINPNSNLDVINDTAKNITFLNHDNNIKLYDQKIKDRDAALQLLQQGQITSGAIDPNDRPYYDTAKKNVQDSFYSMMQNGGINNTSAYKDYLQNVDDLKNVVTQAQSRNIEFAKLNQERSQQPLKEDIAAYDDHIAKQKEKSFWQPIDPFQKAFDYDEPSLTSEINGQGQITKGQLGIADNVPQEATTTWNSTTNKNGVITQKQTTKNAPLKTGLINNKQSKTPLIIQGQQVGSDGTISPYSFTPEKYYDLNSMVKAVDENYATNPTKRFAYQSFLNDVQGLPIQDGLKLMGAYNNRLADYDTQRGIKSDGINSDGTPHYPDQVKYTQDPNSGKLLIQETPVNFFAKHALAKINGDYVQKPEAVFNKDIGNFDVQMKKANTDDIYKRTVAATGRIKANAYASMISSKIKSLKTNDEKDKFSSDMYNTNLIKQPLVSIGGKDSKGNDVIGFSNIPADKSVPMYTMDGKKLPPIGGNPVYSPESYKDGKDDNGDPIKVLKTGATPLYYQGGYYQPTYLLNNKPVNAQQLQNNYYNFKQTKYGKTHDMSFEDYLKGGIQLDKSNQNHITVTLTGADGSTDKGGFTAAQRIISNKNTKKGQQGVFDESDNSAPSEDQVQGNNDNQQQDNNNQ